MTDQGQPGHGEGPEFAGGQPPPYGDPQYAPYGQPPYYGQPSPHYGPPPYGDPQYPPPAEQPLSPYTGAAPSNYGSGGGTRNALWASLIVAFLVVAGVGGYFLLRDDSQPTGNAAFPTQSTAANPSFPASLPSISVPSISIPSISIPSINVPSIPAGFANPCGFATTARTAAITYVGLAEVGQTDFAQGCVYHDAVSKSVTASLKASGSGLYSPGTGGSSSGSTVEFTSIDGTSTIEVTATKESDGKFYITKVKKR